MFGPIPAACRSSNTPTVSIPSTPTSLKVIP
jgi:hypothetical protein